MIFTTTYEKDNPSLLAQLKEANKYLPWINEAAQKFNLQPSIIAGLGSRESHWGLALKPEGPEGTGDFIERRPKKFRPGTLPSDGLGFGRGLLQIDFDWHEFARIGKWADPRENILYGCKLINEPIFKKSRLGGNFSEKDSLRACLAAYNAGAWRVLRDIKQEIDVDTHTSGRNYSADVINRAGWFQLQGWT